MRLLAPLLLAASLAKAEYTPPPTFADLFRADCAAIGRFAVEDGAVRFVAEDVLWGDAEVAPRVLCLEHPPVRRGPDGRLTAWCWGSATWVMSMGGSSPEDATQRALWFFFSSDDWARLVAQPAELREGILLLRGGRRPPALFRLLQRLDFDMRREAMEELVADPDAAVLEELHGIAMRQPLAAANAIEVLLETRLLEAELFWGRWTEHPVAYALRTFLQEVDAERVGRDVRRAIAAETDPHRLDDLLYWAADDLDLSLRHLDHPAEAVRDRALSNLHRRLWALAREPAGADRLGRRLLPLLEARREVEASEEVRRTLDRMLEREEGVPWLLRVRPRDEAEPPAYSEDDERTFVLSRLTSSNAHGFVMESAGREVVEHFFAEGFARLKGAAASRNYNTDMVYDGMGYVRHPEVFAHLVERARTMSVGADAFPETLRAIGRQNHARSFDALKEILDERLPHPGGFAAAGLCDALGFLRDERALALLRELEGALPAGCEPQYLRALVAHGDPEAIEELLAMPGPPRALLLVDTPDGTAAIREHVRDAWPARWEAFDEPRLHWCLGMQNHAGSARRTTALGEAARRDPRWLAGLALREMESEFLTTRVCAAHVFRGLTGRSFGFRPEAFAAERAAPLRELQAWWAEHRDETREEWLRSYFREHGFPVERLHDRRALPVYVQALGADPLTHGLAIERISVITGKYFGNFAQPTVECLGSTMSVGGGGLESLPQHRMTARVVGWLTTRGWLRKADGG